MKSIKDNYKTYFFMSRRINSSKRSTLYPVLHYDKFDDFFTQLKKDKAINNETKVLIALALSGGMRVSEALNLKKEDFSILEGKMIGKVKVLKKDLKITYKEILTERLTYGVSSPNKDIALDRYSLALERWFKALNTSIDREEIVKKLDNEYARILINKSSKKITIDSIVKSEFKTKFNELFNLFKASYPNEAKDIQYLHKTYAKMKKKDKYNSNERLFIPHPKALEIISSYLKGLRYKEKLFKFDRFKARRSLERFIGTSSMHAFRHSFISYLLFKKNWSEERVAEFVNMSTETVKVYSHLDNKEVLKVW
ncbi:MAG: site-specific integrase [Oligoflexia bacterium]|nr:site-specific integrase [Oligoflexia bacterium]